MPFSLNDLVWGLAVPLLLAATLRLGLAALTAQIFHQRSSTRPAEDALPPPRRVFAWETCVPYAAGAGLGYFVLQLGSVQPEAHYEWLPAMVGLAAVVPCLTDAVPGPVWARAIARLLLSVATVAFAGYWLMPTWDDLILPYPVFLATWMAMAAILALALDFSKVPEIQEYGGTWPWAVVVLGTTLAMTYVITESEILRFTQVAGLAFSATAGISLAGAVRREAYLPNLGLPLGTHLAGILLIAQTNSYSNVPWFSYVLPIAGLLLSAVGGQVIGGRFSAAVHISMIILLAAIPATVAVILAALAG